MLKGRHFVSITDLNAGEILALFERARALKAEWKAGGNQPVLAGKTMAMIFEKPSLRTRYTFEAGMTHLGGHGIYLGPSDIRMGVRETVPDVARNLSRWADIIMARTFAHRTIVELAENASVPVINALSDLEHPCQALADLLTVLEHKGTLAGLKFAYIGDGNNVCQSLLLINALLGLHTWVACPAGYEPRSEIVEQARQLAQESGSQVHIVRHPDEAARDADVLYTDVWASMGQEDEAAERNKMFADYQINAARLALAAPDAIVEHCLPAHRGQEITDEVIDGPQSVVLDEAENRLHAQKALVVQLMGL
ncbi:MAG: ornithine carbamoyltransferase [Chloroflexia bacterium]|nr:ornithine carbamoyltransferase [Chloroflexia bacterium]